MFNQCWNAESVKRIANNHAEKANQIQTQLNELQKQTFVLASVQELTQINIKCIQDIVSLALENTDTIKQIAKMTEENQKSSVRQFWASIIVSVTALVIAFGSLLVSIFQYFK